MKHRPSLRRLAKFEALVVGARLASKAVVELSGAARQAVAA
jgi:hypothetical protein